MGQLGFSEMLVIFIVALLVFGPKKLPELGKSLGKGIREFRKATNELKSTWEDQVRDIQAPLSDVKRDIHEMGQDLKSNIYKHIEPEPSPAQPAAEEVPQQHDSHQAAAAANSSQPTESSAPKEHV
jgi:TatA/E family protein of Tat protein translocase